MKKGIHIVYLKKQKNVYITVLLFNLYSTSSCRKLNIHNDLPKSPKSSEFAKITVVKNP